MENALQSTKWCGKERYHFEVTDSTNRRAGESAQKGCSHGALFTADRQINGIGRRGRSWESEAEAGIYMSIVLRPDIKPEIAPGLTLVAALSVAEAINAVWGQKEKHSAAASIKWPNDIVLNKKKICGILTEMFLQGTEIDYIVIGIGINVNNQSFPEQIKQTASSLFLETGIFFEKEMMIEAVWKQFEANYETFLRTGDLQGIKAGYERLLINQNERVKVLDPLGEYEGIAKGITNMGELIVETEQGICEVAGGEVSVRGIYGYV